MAAATAVASLASSSSSAAVAARTRPSQLSLVTTARLSVALRGGHCGFAVPGGAAPVSAGTGQGGRLGAGDQGGRGDSEECAQDGVQHRGQGAGETRADAVRWASAAGRAASATAATASRARRV